MNKKERQREATRRYRERHPDRARASSRESSRKCRIKNPQRVRELQIIRTYGITLVDKQDLLELQGHKCANSNCTNTEPGGRCGVWNVDHDHKTLRVRGLLCHTCNLALGMLGDDAERIRGLALYLENNNV